MNLSAAARILFLDDDPDRAAAFIATWPDAVWVATVEDCLDRLQEPWDEVHLDHDLGGEVFVDPDREDCGMAVVRWLCDHPPAHLRAARFVVHSHNPNAACVMALHLRVSGYQVEVQPFGLGIDDPSAHPFPARLFAALIRPMRGWLAKRRLEP